MFKYFVIVLGWAYMALAIWWFFRPKRIRKAFERNARRKMRWLLITAAFVLGGVIFQAGREVGGWIGTLLIVIGIIALIKGLMFFSKSACDKIFGWWSVQSDGVYRLAAVGLFIVGFLAQLLFRAE